MGDTWGLGLENLVLFQPHVTRRNCWHSIAAREQRGSLRRGLGANPESKSPTGKSLLLSSFQY